MFCPFIVLKLCSYSSFSSNFFRATFGVWFHDSFFFSQPVRYIQIGVCVCVCAHFQFDLYVWVIKCCISNLSTLFTSCFHPIARSLFLPFSYCFFLWFSADEKLHPISSLFSSFRFVLLSAVFVSRFFFTLFLSFFWWIYDVIHLLFAEIANRLIHTPILWDFGFILLNSFVFFSFFYSWQPTKYIYTSTSSHHFEFAES